MNNKQISQTVPKQYQIVTKYRYTAHLYMYMYMYMKVIYTTIILKVVFAVDT